jgi:hypothetical protein
LPARRKAEHTIDWDFIGDAARSGAPNPREQLTRVVVVSLPSTGTVWPQKEKVGRPAGDFVAGESQGGGALEDQKVDPAWVT